MNLHKKSLHSVLAIGLALTAITSAFGQRLVTVYADEAAYASEQAITYEAMCPSGKYRLTFRQNDDRVGFDFEGGNNMNVDLSATPFGTTFLQKALHGKFYSTCPKDGITIHFWGIEPKNGPTLRAVKYRLTIGSDGVITDDGGLVEASGEGINFIFLRKLQQQTPALKQFGSALIDPKP